MGRAFSSSYVAGEAAARAFIAADFRDPATRIARARAAAQRPLPASVMAVLRAQQQALPASGARQGNLDALAAGGAAVVVTGQQVGLFGGPLYSFYKAASAVAVARTIQAESGVRCVPLFWLQTEDHDYAEIAGCTVAGPAGAPVRLALPDEAPAEARVSVAHRTLGAEVSGLIDALGDALDGQPATAEVLALLRAHYLPGRPLAVAFAGLIGALFADDGLLVLDPRQAEVAALAAPVYRRALAGAAEIEALLRQRCAALATAGFGTQIPIRPACALLFFHRGDAAGPRFRLQRTASSTGAAWTLSGSGETLTDDELAQTLAADPLRFSTSALLRPLVQDALLRTVAYVGGPGELNYLAQLAPLYDHFGLAPPLVIPRARFRCVDAGTRRRLQQLGLTADELSRPRVELLGRLSSAAPIAAPDPSKIRARVLSEVMPLVEELTGAVSTAAPHLQRAAARTTASVLHALTRLTNRYRSALGERDQSVTTRLDRTRAALYPGGEPQERVYGWPSPAARIGPAAFRKLVFDALAAAGPFTTTVQDLLP